MTRIVERLRLRQWTLGSLGDVGFDSNGRLYFHNGTRTYPADNVEAHDFSITGQAQVVTGQARIYFDADVEIAAVRISAGTAPTGASLIADVNKNGTTVYTTQANRPTIPAGSTFGGTTALPNTISFSANTDYLSVDIDQVGSTVPGSDVTVTVRCRRTN